MTDPIRTMTIKSHSSPEQIDAGYRLMCDTYRRLITDYCSTQNVLLSEVIRDAGCTYIDITERFITKGDVSSPGVDLDYLLNYTNTKQRFVDENPVFIGSDVSYFEAIHGTSIDEKGNLIDLPGSAVPESLDRYVIMALSKLSWFYEQAVERYFKEQDSA